MPFTNLFLTYITLYIMFYTEYLFGKVFFVIFCFVFCLGSKQRGKCDNDHRRARGIESTSEGIIERDTENE